MIRNILQIGHKEDYRKLIDLVPSEYMTPQLLKLMMTNLSERIKTVVVEYPYVDKDYRSTYYGFYSKRHRFYDKFCFRLHFFEVAVNSGLELLKTAECYLGSMVLRPTEITPMGRTLLSPKAIKDFEGYICETRFENNLMGIPLMVNTFPHTMQDTDVTVCAHAVCWMISRYYSEKYSVYPERQAFEIAEAVKDLSQGRIIPSKGLTLGQVSEILSSIGFYPEMFVRQLYADDAFFYDILYSYVESGIPVVGALAKKQHAVAIVGHGPLRNITQDMVEKIGKFINTRHLCEHLVVNDDNYLPFETMSNGRSPRLHRHSLSDVDAFVVPLYEKMYLNAENVLKLFPRVAESKLLSIPDHEYIVRIFMTSSRSYKRKLHIYGDSDEGIHRSQLELPMPKFIWIVELSSSNNYYDGKTNFRWVIDATANQYEKLPYLFIHDGNHAIIQDRALTGKIFHMPFEHELKPYPMYTNNLRKYSCQRT